MEVYARELIPRLAALAGVELVALVNREAAGDREAPWGNAIPMEVVPVHARNRVEWVRGEQQHVPRLAAAAGADLIHSLASTAPLRSRDARASRRSTTSTTSSSPTPTSACARWACGCSSRRRRAARTGSSSTPRRPSATWSRISARRSARSTSRRSASRPRRRSRPTPAGELRARLGLGDGPVLLTVSAKRPHKNLLRLLDAVALLEDRPTVVLPGYPTPHEAELRERAARAGRARGLPRLGLRRGPRGPVRARRGVRVPLAGRGLRAAGARGDGARRAGGVQRPLRRCPRSRATPRCCSTRTTRGRSPTRCGGSRPRRERLRAAGRARAAQFTWERCAELTAAAYARTLAA